MSRRSENFWETQENFWKFVFKEFLSLRRSLDFWIKVSSKLPRMNDRLVFGFWFFLEGWRGEGGNWPLEMEFWGSVCGWRLLDAYCLEELVSREARDFLGLGGKGSESL